MLPLILAPLCLQLARVPSKDIDHGFGGLRAAVSRWQLAEGPQKGVNRWSGLSPTLAPALWHPLALFPPLTEQSKFPLLPSSAPWFVRSIHTIQYSSCGGWWPSRGMSAFSGPAESHDCMTCSRKVGCALQLRHTSTTHGASDSDHTIRD